ncbi:MAG: hypothetical protein LBM98_07250 [Oscillospiraceae bacterium]|nr:hypothetical protein [Oscillospiraceae bacterium]
MLRAYTYYVSQVRRRSQRRRTAPGRRAGRRPGRRTAPGRGKPPRRLRAAPLHRGDRGLDGARRRDAISVNN